MNLYCCMPHVHMANRRCVQALHSRTIIFVSHLSPLGVESLLSAQRFPLFPPSNFAWWLLILFDFSYSILVQWWDLFTYTAYIRLSLATATLQQLESWVNVISIVSPELSFLSLQVKISGFSCETVKIWKRTQLGFSELDNKIEKFIDSL